MKNFLLVSFATMFFSVNLFAQKGVDPQTRRIREEGNKTTNATGGSANPQIIDWGKGKTKLRDVLPNPYKLNSRRDVLLETITNVLKERKIMVDEAASRPANGIIVTQPFVFAKGAVISQNEINRYATLQNSATVWTRGQFTLTIEVQSIDGIQNNVAVTAKVEGRSGNGLETEWTTLQSSGIAEDEFLSKLVEAVTGNSPDAQPVTDQ